MPPRKRKKAAPEPRGIEAAEVAAGSPPPDVRLLREEIEQDGGKVLAEYREPLGSKWQLMAALPITKVFPTPFQRDLSEAHVKRLTGVIDKLDRFLDPIIAVRSPEGSYWTPNGHHRLSALRKLGARAVIALVLPDPDVAYKILALNTEKAHNLREKSLEVIRMARELASREKRPEKEYSLEFEEAAFVTLGICYEKNGRFAGGAYHPLLKRVDAFLDSPLPAALRAREGRARALLELDEAVVRAMKGLQARGFQSPYLRAFVVARVNPIRFKKGPADFDETLEKMTAAAERFKTDAVRPDQIARAAGPPEE
ncbi:MAG: ParB N-terminal domain-containing protein [Thermoanaerobaculia bacterium]